MSGSDGDSKAARWWGQLREAVLAADRWTVLVLAVSFVSVAWPLASVEYFPMVDYPQHLATVAAIHGRGELPFSAHFVLEYGRSQYLAFYVMSDMLAHVLGVEGATRFVVIVQLALLPVSVAMFLGAHRRPPMLGAVAGAVALHMYVFWGFINFAVSIWVAFAALAAMAHMIRRPGPASAALYAALCLLCFYSHAQMYAFLAVASVLQLAAMAPAVGRTKAARALGYSAAAAVPSVLATLAWLGNSSFLETGEAPARSGIAEQLAEQGAEFSSVQDTVRGFFSQSFDVYRDGGGLQIAVAFGLVLLLLFAMRGASRRRNDGARESWAPELVLALAIGCYLFAPLSYKLVSPINHRFLPVALALLPVLGPIRLGTVRRDALVGGAAIALCLFTMNTHQERFELFQEEVGELGEALSHAQGGKRLLGLVHDRDSGIVPLPLHLHMHQYYQARNAGVAAWSFVEMPKSPIRWNDAEAPPPFPARFEWTPQRFDSQRWGAWFDYFLIRRRPGHPTPRIFPPGDPASPGVLFEGPRWTLLGRD